MAKFKVGDKVKATESSRRGQVGKIIYVGDSDPNDVKYEVEFDKKENGMKRLGFNENELVKVYNSYLKAVVTNGIGDCFSDAAYSCEKALRGNADANLKAALHDVEYVTSYSYADAKDKAGKAKCVAAIKAAISNPTKDNIAKAKKACDEERKRADGIMPTFNNLATRNAVVSNALAWCGKAVCNGQTEFERYAEIAEKAARSAYDRGDKVRVQEILKDLKSHGGMSADKAIKKIEAKYVNAEPVAKNADDFNEFMKSKEMQDASNSKSKAFARVKDVQRNLENAESDVADARVRFLYAMEKASSLGIGIDKRLAEEKSKMEKAEKMIVQAIALIKSATSMFN